MKLLIVILPILASFIAPLNAFGAEIKTFVAARYFCSVEIRAGNTGNPLNHPIVYSGQMQAGQKFSYEAVFIWAQREGNPGSCNSGRGQWNQCSWDECTLN